MTAFYDWLVAQAARTDPPPVPCARCGNRWLMQDPLDDDAPWVWGRLPVCPLCLAKDEPEAPQ